MTHQRNHWYAIALLLACAQADAKVFDGLYLFGDSFTDTGSLGMQSNGSTAGGYLASFYGIPLTTNKNLNPGSSGIISRSPEQESFTVPSRFPLAI